MKELFMEYGWLITGMGFFLLISILCQLVVVYYLLQLVKESERLEVERAKYLGKWIEEYLKEKNKIINSTVFIDKKIQEFGIGRFTLIQIKHFSGQSLLFVIFLAGMGACMGIIKGKTLGQILPFYIVSLFGLYLHFSLSGLINMEENRKTIKMNMVDFLENKNPYYYIQGTETGAKDIEEVKEIFGKAEEVELREIIKEILT